MLRRALSFLAGALILKVTFVVLLGYRDYFPPNFESPFLRGRQAYFYGVYQGAFVAHIVAGPLTLILGLVLISETVRARWPRLHRTLGKCQIALILLMLAPSGVWMAFYVETGPVAGAGFFALALATGLCAILGWRSAVRLNFVEHRRWMERCFLLLCSAVVLRLIGGLVVVAGVEREWTYPVAAWASWLVPLAAFELARSIERRASVSTPATQTHSSPISSSLSLPAIEINARR